MTPILNLSAYRFVAIADPHALKEAVYAEAAARSLKGTVLLAEEGINLFLAGEPAAVRDWVSWLHADPRFAPMEPKESWSATVPFRRLKVKVKREIIRMNHPTIRPEDGRAPSVPPETLARWLQAGHDDAGREVVTLDTRNAFEVDHGAFEGAIDWRLDKFSDFPAALEAHRHELEGKTVVSYCTGGIRCEKAALYMRRLGLESVYQLEGGILKYFEETASPGWKGDCFVFDEREALTTGLDPRDGQDGLSSTP
ncbi:MAG TPA: sulfurtransferase [Stenomitos sp.]